MNETSSDILRVLRREQPKRRPVWFMRQAGRCLPEYRELRKKHGFAELMSDPDIATKVTLMPLERFDLDAAILFTDLLVVLEAMGVELEYTPGPELSFTVSSREDLAQLRPFDPAQALAVPLETSRRVREALPPEKAVLGFVGAPWTLAAYLIEGKGTKSWTKLRALAWQDEALFGEILDKLVDGSIAFGRALLDAGCDAVQVFDSWAGIAEPLQFRRLLLPRLQRLIDGIKQSGSPVIYFVNGAMSHLPTMIETNADALAIDWKIDMKTAHEIMPPGLPVQGNLDPQALFAPASVIEREVERIVACVGDRPHIFNVGHGFDPKTPLEGVQCAVDALRRLDR